MDLLLTFYGDDFTGSTDAMECLEMNGIPAVLFLDPPTPEQVRERFPNVRGVGVAGVSRTMSPEQMDADLTPVFEALKLFGAPFFHYKICSTFDSSPAIGSIGHAIDIGFRVFDPRAVPLVVGAPLLRRYVAFSNLFARVGDVTYRLDRHPTMSRHPITPMTESDLRLHLGRQTSRSVGAIDVWHLSQPDSDVDCRFRRLIEDGIEIIVFDTLDERHMRTIGRLIWSLGAPKTDGSGSGRPAFLVGSSSVEYSLGMHLRALGLVGEPDVPHSVGDPGPLVVVSGSCAPGSDEQIQYALDHGFAGVPLDGPRLVDPASAGGAREAAAAQALELLDRGQSVVLYSARGPEDPCIGATNQRLVELGLDPRSIGWRLGAQQGLLLRDILERGGIRRACVAGGDTCGHASRQLGIYALRMVMPVAPGAPLCRVFSNEPRFNGLEISLKGGQNGTAEYFVQIQRGHV